MILASDKTKLSQFRGDQTAWPVYLSVGNIPKARRRQISSHATLLIGYIPVSKLECFPTGDERRYATYRLYHHCMRELLKPLIQAGKSGVSMVCADGAVRNIFPILAAYVADHPEQCLVTNVQENHCPRGKIASDLRGEPRGCVLRSVDETISLLEKHRNGEIEGDLPHGLCPVYDPFWADLPHCDIYSCITPDILHQLHKGVFKDHLVTWVTALIESEELDRRFRAMSNIPGLRHFKKGISSIQQWTGTEFKEMQKAFVPLVAGAVDSRVLQVVQAIINFIYYAQLHVHTSVTLDALEHSLALFHQHKEVLIGLGVRQHFNIAKIHSMTHYVDAIRDKGCLDGFNTELFERLHIDFAKVAYRAGNRRDYIANMTKWLVRQEAVKLRIAYLDWIAIEGKEGEDQDVQASSESELEASTNEDQDPRFSTPDTPLLYSLAKRCPFPRRKLEFLEEEHEAMTFLTAFQEFVDRTWPASTHRPSRITRYNVYKQLKITQPWNSWLGNQERRHRVRAIAPVKEARSRARPTSGYFDPVLVIEDESKYQRRTQGSLDGTYLDACWVSASI